MKKPSQHLIAEVPHRQPQLEMTIGIDLGDVWSHYCTPNQGGDIVGRGRFRTTPKAIEKWFTDLPPSRVAMEAGTRHHQGRQRLAAKSSDDSGAFTSLLEAASRLKQSRRGCRAQAGHSSASDLDHARAPYIPFYPKAA